VQSIGFVTPPYFRPRRNGAKPRYRHSEKFSCIPDAFGLFHPVFVGHLSGQHGFIRGDDCGDCDLFSLPGMVITLAPTARPAADSGLHGNSGLLFGRRGTVFKYRGGTVSWLG